MTTEATGNSRFRAAGATPEQILEGMDQAELRVHVRALQTLTEAILAHRNLPELLDELLQRIRTVLAVETATVLLCGEGGGVLIPRASSGLEEEVEQRVQIPMGQGIAGTVAVARKPVIVDDVSRIRTVSPAIRRLSSMMVAPLLAGDEILGVLHVGTLSPRRFTDQNLYLLQVAADRIALAIRNALTHDRERAECEERNRTDWDRALLLSRSELLARASRELASSLDFEKTLANVAHIAVPELADWCFVTAVGSGGAIELLAVGHQDPQKEEFAREAIRRFPLDPQAGFGTAQVIRSGEPVLRSEMPHPLTEAEEADPERRQMLDFFGFQSYLAVPLEIHGAVIGTLSLLQAESGRHFEEADVPFVQELGLRAASAIENARLFGAVEQREREQNFLSETSALLAGSLDIDDTLRHLTRLIVERLADACAVDLARPDGSLHRASVTSRDPRMAEIVIELEDRYPTPLDSPAGHATAFREGQPLLYNDFPDELLRSASVDEEHFRLWKSLEMESVINVPLIARDNILGVISVVSNTAGRKFTAADLDIAVELASRAALAIDNARLYAEAREANRAKTDFLAAMSHELRTPLNAIAGYADLMHAEIHGPVTEAQRHSLERIIRSQGYLLTLINDVLHFAKLEAGRLEFNLVELPLHEVLTGIAAAVDPQAQARGIRFTADCHQSLAAFADPDRLRQILLNLIGNSLKFTPSGGNVRLRCEEDGERVYMIVEDDGRGIPEDRLEAIFDPFVQVDRHRHESSQQGVGLGLAISRDLARGMGGELSATSDVGVGSQFTVSLPRYQRPPASVVS